MNQNRQTLGFNTMAPPSVLRQSCILCAGEDRRELLKALVEAGPPAAKAFARSYLNRLELNEDANGPPSSAPTWRYRGYEFWPFSDFVIILSGIGTGSLEPLLFELLRSDQISKIILVGTAGALQGGKANAGNAYFIERAWPVATGINTEELKAPLVPRWRHGHTAKTATAVSSDLYYGFSPLLFSQGYPLHDARLKALFEHHLAAHTDLIDMEIAQFFFFCANYGQSDLQYAAVTATSNAAGDNAERPERIGEAIAQSVAVAFELLGIPTKASQIVDAATG